MSTQPDRTSQRTIFVGGLPLEVTKETIDFIFEDYGEIVDYQFKKSSVAGTASAFITFATHEQAEIAIKECNYTKMNGNPIRISWQSVNPRHHQVEANLVISNLPLSVEDVDLHACFSSYGEVESCRILRNKSGVSQGKGFVQFANVEDANRALEDSQNATIENQLIIIEKYKPADQRQDMQVQLQHNSIYVDGPQEKMTKENLTSVFSKYGEITNIISIDNYCVVFFAAPQSACALNSDAENLSKQGYNVQTRVPKITFVNINKAIESRKIFVSDIIANSPEELRAHLSKAGPIISFELHDDKYGQHFASVQYNSEETQEIALKTLDRTSFGSQSLPISVHSYVEKNLAKQTGGLIMLPMLDYHVTFQQLREEYSQFGKIVAVSICPTPQSTLVGFVLFKEFQAAKAAQERNANTNSFLFPPLELTKFNTAFMATPTNPNIFLYVSGISKDVSDTQIYSEYTKYGRIHPVNTVTVGEEKFAFIHFVEQSGILTAAAALSKTSVKYMVLSTNTLNRAQLTLNFEAMPAEYYNRFMFVNSVEPTINPDALFQIFSKNGGKVEAVFCSYDLQSWNSLGKSFVLFADCESASKCYSNPLQYTPELSDSIIISPFMNRAALKESIPMRQMPPPLQQNVKVIRQPRKVLRERVPNLPNINKEQKEKITNMIASLSVNQTYEFASNEILFEQWYKSILE